MYEKRLIANVFSVEMQGFGKLIYLRFKTFHNHSNLSLFNSKIKNLTDALLITLTGGS